MVRLRIVLRSRETCFAPRRTTGFSTPVRHPLSGRRISARNDSLTLFGRTQSSIRFDDKLVARHQGGFCMRRFAMVQMDVFTKKRLEGNGLAVFTDATGLSDAEMQAVAKETNLSETTYVFPRDAATEKVRGVRVRIFTVAEELPFAGHPTLGTAFVLRAASGVP